MTNGDEQPPLLSPFDTPEISFGLLQRASDGDQMRGSARTGAWMLDAAGAPIATSIAVLMDDMMAAVAMLHRDPDLWPVTGELTLDFLRPLPTDGVVTAVAHYLYGDRARAFARAELTDDTGTVLVAGSSWLANVPGPDPALADVQETTRSWGPQATSGGSFFSPTEAEGGIRYPRDERHVSVRRTVHGGVITAMAEDAARRLLPQLPAVLLSIRVRYLRPMVASVVASVTPVHLGRSLAEVDVTFRSDDGKTIARAVCAFRP